MARTDLKNIRSRWGAYRQSRALKRLVRAAKPLRVVLGAGGPADKGWIATDIDVLDIVDERDWQRYFRPDSIDVLLAEHVWEHLPPAAALLAAANCHRYLKPGGYLRSAVPDGFHPDPSYIEWVRVGGIGPGADDHQVLYNGDTFRDLFVEAGFQEVELLEYFDSAGVFHGVDWDPAGGKILRSKRFDERNRDGGLHYTSIIVDARKK